MNDKINIGKTIKVLRTAAGLKQKELAEKVGVSANYLSMVEGNKREPSLSFLKSMSRELKVPIGFLFLQLVEGNDQDWTEEQKTQHERLKSLLLEFQKLRLRNEPS